MASKTILITGAAGFLGRHLTTHLAETEGGARLHSLGLQAPDDVRIQHHACDMADGEKVRAALAEIRPSEIYHLVGTARVSKEISAPEYFESNFLTTAHLARAIEVCGITPAVFLASSVHVYGNRPEEIDEAAEVAPLSPYAHSKYLAELALRDLSTRLPAVRVVIGRLYSCIGPGQPAGFVTSDLARRLATLTPGAPLQTGALVGFRRFLDVRDAVALFPRLLASTALASGEVVHIASSEEVTIREIVERLIRVSGKTPSVQSDSTADSQAFTGLRLSVDKLRRLVPDAVARPLDETLRDIWTSTLNNLAVSA